MYGRETRRRALLIVNAKAGNTRGESMIGPAVTALSEGGWETTAFTTTCRGDATRIAADYGADCDLLVCSGGDGTMNEVIRGLMLLEKEQRPAIGYIPLGSTNDFAAALRLPKTREQMIDVAINGVEREVDVGCFNGRHYAYLASFGAFTDMSYSTPQEAKNTFGFLAYLGSGMTSLANIRPIPMTVLVDGKLIHEEFAFGAVSNTACVAGVINYRNAAIDLNDGLFEVILIKYPNNPIEIGRIAHSITAGDFDCDLVTHFRCSEIGFSFDDPIPWMLDGELAECGHEIIIKNVHSAVRIMVPRIDMGVLQNVK